MTCGRCKVGVAVVQLSAGGKGHYARYRELTDTTIRFLLHDANRFWQALKYIQSQSNTKGQNIQNIERNMEYEVVTADERTGTLQYSFLLTK